MNTKRDIIDRELIQELADILRETGLNEIEIEAKGTRIRASLGNGGVIMAPTAAPPGGGVANDTPGTDAAPSPNTPPADHPGALKSPMVGTVYMSPEPGAGAFVKVGDEVEMGQTLLIIEAMKVMNPIPAPKAGVVKEIMVGDAHPVEFGDILLIIE